MFDWIKKNWLPAGLSAVAGALALMVYEKHAAAATPATPAPSTAPATATVALQPGQTTVSVAPGGSVLLTLPSGASWSSSTTPISPLASTGVQPTGSNSMNIVMSSAAGVFPLTANWVDSSGNAQSTLINVAVG